MELPAKVLEHNIIFEFEKLAAANGHDFRRAVERKLVHPEIEYEVDTCLPRGPKFDHKSREIRLHDSYLAFLWAYIYSQFVIYEVGVQLRMALGTWAGAIEFDSELLRRARRLELWAIDFAKTYTPWDEYVLPSPRNPCAGTEEKSYIEKANAVFLKAVVFLLFHEYAHAIFQHVPAKSDSLESDESKEADNLYQLEQEKEADNFALDQVIFTCTSEDEKTIAGLSLVLLCSSSLFLVSEARSIWQRRHPDLHERIRHAISKLDLRSEKSKDYLYYLASKSLRDFLEKHGFPLDRREEETAEDLFFRHMETIDRIRI